MASPLDSVLPTIASDVIDTFGTNATFYVYSGGSYDPTTGGMSGSTTETTHTVKITPPAPYDIRLRDGDNIRDGDVEFVFAASGLSFTPTEGQKVTVYSTDYHIVRLTTIPSGDSITAYEAQARRVGS